MPQSLQKSHLMVWIVLFIMLPALLYSAIDYALFRKTDWRSVLTSTALLLLCVGWTLSFALITPRVS